MTYKTTANELKARTFSFSDHFLGKPIIERSQQCSNCKARYSYDQPFLVQYKYGTKCPTCNHHNSY